MNPDLLHLLGYPAAALTTLAFVPQAWMTLRTRNVQGISAATYLALTVGVFLWLIYGISERDWALVVANGITLPLAGSILTTKLLVMRQERQRVSA
jgi:MtN3 and saliva related transmembrane protein